MGSQAVWRETAESFHTYWDQVCHLGGIYERSQPLYELNALAPSERNLRIANLRVNACLLGLSIVEEFVLQVYVTVTDVTVHPSASLALATTGVVVFLRQ